jgi:uncharacterized protein
MSDYTKPLPKPSPTSRPFWDAAKQHKLQLQKCDACGKFVYYPRDRCPYCFADALKWAPASGRGTVYSYTVVRRSSSRKFMDPYILAIVELEEGPRLTTNIIAPPEEVRVAMPVVVHFDDVTPDHTLVKFKPA